MEIIDFEIYKDGGTVGIITDEGTYCFDNRLNSSTKGQLYNDYPKKDNSNIIKENLKEIEKNIITSLKSYKSEFYQYKVNELINNNIM